MPQKNRTSSLILKYWLKFNTGSNVTPIFLPFRPTSTDFGRIMSVLYKEKDYEVINYVYSIFEQFANSINPSPCWKKQRENAEFFLRFMKQYRR